MTFVIGGLSGVILASPTLDFHLHDSYFVVAHFHYVMGGTVVFALFAAIYFWWPKVTGRFLSPTLGAIHFWLLLIGFHMTFFVMHVMGYQGLPRRVVDYPAIGAYERWNVIATVGYAIQALVDGAVRDRHRPFVASAADRRRRPVARQLARVVDDLAAAAPQLRVAAADPLRAPDVRLRWINDPEVSAVGPNDAWRARNDHDSGGGQCRSVGAARSLEPKAESRQVKREPRRA